MENKHFPLIYIGAQEILGRDEHGRNKEHPDHGDYTKPWDGENVYPDWEHIKTPKLSTVTMGSIYDEHEE